MHWSEELNELEKCLRTDRWAKYRAAPDGIPKILYHYTDAAGLKGILESRQIWATHILYLNDPHEVRHGYDLARSVLGRIRNESEGTKQAFAESCLANLEEQTRVDTHLSALYCASFSGKKDDLSQYRAYSDGGAGYCIGFSSEILMEYMERTQYAGGPLFNFVQMSYDNDRHKKSMTDYIEQACVGIDALIDNHSDARSSDVLHRISLICVQSLVELSSYVKQPGFRDEEEWRLMPWIHGIPPDPKLSKNTDVRIRNGIFVPHIQLPIGDETGPLKSLKEIYIGPKLPQGPAEFGLHDLMTKLSIEEDGHCVKFERSSTFLQ